LANNKKILSYVGLACSWKIISEKNNIDVYLAPLLDELQLLWKGFMLGT
jgi:hypothetical protein